MQSLEPTHTSIKLAAKRLLAGELVALPTETVYGLGGNALDGIAIAKIFDMKGRPQFNPLISHVGNIALAEQYALFNKTAYKLAEAFWPGPLTLILPKRQDCQVSELVTAGLDTIAIRIPNHPVAQKLLNICNCPIAAPSANRSGHVSPTTAKHVADDFKDKDLLVLDAGATGIGLESTVVNCTNETVKILRPGGIERKQIEAVLGYDLPIQSQTNDHNPSSPGQLTSHYAPNAKVRLNATTVSSDEALLAFGNDIPSGAKFVFNLSKTSNLNEAAANLFSGLRKLDETQIDKIAVMAIPNEDLGEAINDRLKRAAAIKE